MSITSGNERDSTNIGNIAIGLYYYFVDKNKINEANYLGYAPSIESISYNPFINESDLSLNLANFDVDRFGTPSGGIPKCYRIMSNPKIVKTLGEIQLFPNKADKGDYYEPKMSCYPFRYFLVTDYYNPPLLIKPELVHGSDNKLRIKVKTAPCSQESKYNIFVENYKKDGDGNLEGNVNNSSLMLPVASSAYAQFLATSSSSFNQNVINSLIENDTTLRQGQNTALLNYQHQMTSTVMGGIGNLLSLNFGGLASNVANGIFANKQHELNISQMNETSQMKEQQINSMYNAKVSDMLSTPRSLKTCGNDSIFNLINSYQKIDVIEYEPQYAYKQRLQEYFNRYGYNIYKNTHINFKTRKYFNYIKTITCNIGSARVPYKDLEEIKNIFNSGLTFWHVDNGATIGNYLVNNEEV